MTALQTIDLWSQFLPELQLGGAATGAPGTTAADATDD
jgi:hypothetical protein